MPAATSTSTTSCLNSASDSRLSARMDNRALDLDAGSDELDFDDVDLTGLDVFSTAPRPARTDHSSVTFSKTTPAAAVTLAAAVASISSEEPLLDTSPPPVLPRTRLRLLPDDDDGVVYASVLSPQPLGDEPPTAAASPTAVTTGTSVFECRCVRCAICMCHRNAADAGLF